MKIPGRKPGVAFAANHLLAVILLRQHAERRLDNATAKAKHQMERRLLLDVVVGQSAAILQLLAGEDQTLLIGWNAFFVLKRERGWNVRFWVTAYIQEKFRWKLTLGPIKPYYPLNPLTTCLTWWRCSSEFISLALETKISQTNVKARLWMTTYKFLAKHFTF